MPRTRSSLSQQVTRPIIRLLAKTSLTPSALTWIGFLITAGAAALIIFDYLFIAGFVVLFAGLFDMLDGALARQTNRTSRFGAVLDSVLDRFSEAVLLLAIIALYAAGQNFTMTVVTSITLFLSQTVSYIRSRAEALGIECKEGIFTRPERVVILALGLWLSRLSFALATAIAIIGVLSFITVIQRMVLVWRQTR